MRSLARPAGPGALAEAGRMANLPGVKVMRMSGKRCRPTVKSCGAVS